MLRILRLSDCETFDFERRTSLNFGPAPLSVEAGAPDRILITCEHSRRTVRVGEVFYLGSEFFLLLPASEPFTTLHDAQGFPPKICRNVTTSPATFISALLSTIRVHATHRTYASIKKHPRAAAQIALVLLALLAVLGGRLSGSVAEAPERDETPTSKEQLYHIMESLLRAAPPPERAPEHSAEQLSPKRTLPKRRPQTRRHNCSPAGQSLTPEARAFMTAEALRELDRKRNQECSP